MFVDSTAKKPNNLKALSRNLTIYFWMSTLCWLQWCMGQLSSQPSFIQMLHWRSQRWRKTRTSNRDLSLFTLVTEQTTVCSVLSSFSRKPEVWVAWEDFCFIFIFISPSPQCLSLTEVQWIKQLLFNNWIRKNLILWWNYIICAVKIQCAEPTFKISLGTDIRHCSK